MSESAHNPLAQFEIHPITWLPPLKLGHIDLSFTNASLWMLICLAAVSFLMFMGTRNRQLVPNRWQSASEMLMEFIGNTVLDAAGEDAIKFFPLIFSLFHVISVVL